MAATKEADRAAVEAVACEYFEAWFAGDPARMQAVLHPRLVKRYLAEDGSGPSRALDGSDMVQRTGDGGGSDHSPEERLFDVEVADVYGDIASVIVRSVIYREYLHIGRVEGRWQIVDAFFASVGDGP
ncbi:MAG: nuclear transport factor 2 family protein [Actinomycetota bacterium]|nr:nuclear transport factor 2 family protein [Actinomycetota bacterium]